MFLLDYEFAKLFLIGLHAKITHKNKAAEYTSIVYCIFAGGNVPATVVLDMRLDNLIMRH